MIHRSASDPLDLLLQRTRWSAGFRADVAAWADRRPQDRLRIVGHAPAVKVERLLRKLAEELGDEPLERLEIHGRSGCSDFVGHALAEPGGIHIRFDWNCAWKAREVGYIRFGMPDQQRAAQEFGHDCFRRFEVRR